jgi:hypothetical protein
MIYASIYRINFVLWIIFRIFVGKFAKIYKINIYMKTSKTEFLGVLFFDEFGKSTFCKACEPVKSEVEEYLKNK